MSGDNINRKVSSKGKDMKLSFIKNYFLNHADDIKENAEKNAQEFLHTLDNDMKIVAEQLKAHETVVNENLKSPDFSKTLEQAIKIATITKDRDKKDVLASLITERLFNIDESTESLIIKMACQKIESLNFTQLSVLAYVQAFRYAKTELDFDNHQKPYEFEALKKILIERFLPYYQLPVTHIDLECLESLGCIQRDNQWKSFLSSVIMPNYFLGNKLADQFYNTFLAQKLLNDWDKNELNRIFLLPVGNEIARHVRVVLNNKTESNTKTV